MTSGMCNQCKIHIVTYEGFAWLITIDSGLDDWIYCISITITINYNSSQSMTDSGSLHSLLDYECLLFHCDWPDSDLRVTHFLFTNAEYRKKNPFATESLNSLTEELRLTCERTLLSVQPSLMLRPTIRRPLSWNKAPIWGLRPDFISQTAAGLLIWGALSDERTGLSFTISAGPCQRSHSRVPILQSQIRDFPFRRLLRLAGLRWRYSIPRSHVCSLHNFGRIE
jgi:hypothetical protein